MRESDVSHRSPSCNLGMRLPTSRDLLFLSNSTCPSRWNNKCTLLLRMGILNWPFKPDFKNWLSLTIIQCSCRKQNFSLSDIEKCSRFIQVVMLWTFEEHLSFPTPNLLMDYFEVVHYVHFCSQSLLSFHQNAHNMLNTYVYHQLLI